MKIRPVLAIILALSLILTAGCAGLGNTDETSDVTTAADPVQDTSVVSTADAATEPDASTEQTGPSSDVTTVPGTEETAPVTEPVTEPGTEPVTEPQLVYENDKFRVTLSKAVVSANETFTVVVTMKTSEGGALGVYLSDASDVTVVSGEWIGEGPVKTFDPEKNLGALLVSSGSTITGDVFRWTLKVSKSTEFGLGLKVRQGESFLFDVVQPVSVTVR
ncbi:MAG: hypothetical protein ILO42_00385 [Clostridia bacterium]|nr:hypothetical protein [Clostridia bacterium]